MSTPKYPVLAVFIVGFGLIAGSHLFEQVFSPDKSAQNTDPGTTAVTDGSQQIDVQNQVVETIVALESEVPTVMPENDTPPVQLQSDLGALEGILPRDVVQVVTADSAKDFTAVTDGSEQNDLKKQVIETIAALESEGPTVIPENETPSVQLQSDFREIEEMFPRDAVQYAAEDAIEDSTIVSDRSRPIGVQQQEAETRDSLELAENIAIPADNMPLAQMTSAYTELEDELPEDLLLDARENSTDSAAIALDENLPIGEQEQVIETINSLERIEPTVLPSDDKPPTQLQPTLIGLEDDLQRDFVLDASDVFTNDVTVGSDESQPVGVKEQVVESKVILEPMDETLATRSQPSVFEMEDNSLQTEQVMQLLNEQLPGIVFSDIKASAVPDLFEVVADGQIYYVNESAEYLIEGSLIRLSDRENITDGRLGHIHIGLIDGIDEEDMLIYEPESPSNRSITVFTDISCGYCRLLHSEIDTLMDAGIRVRYLLFPRAGLGTQAHRDLESVWCADNPQEAMTTAKAGGNIEAMSCDNPIDEHVALAEQLGLRGTPLIYTDSGEKIEGYREPQVLATMVNDNVPTVQN